MDINVQVKPSIQIRAFYLYFIITSTQFGVGILEAPAAIFPFAKQDVLISILIAYAYMMIVLFVMLLILKQYKNADIFGIQVDLFGKWIGKLIGIVWLAYFSISLVSILMRYIEIIMVFLYPALPPFVTTSLLMALTVYCILGGFRTIVGVCFLFFFLTQVVFILLYHPMMNLEFDRILPIFQASIPDLLKSARETTYSFLGLEVFFLVYPFVSNKQNLKKPAILALSYSAFVVLMTTIISIGYFSLHTIEGISYPVLTLFRGIAYPFIERLDYIIVVEWMMVILPNCIILYWSITYGLKRLFSIPQRKSLYIIAFVVIVVTSFYQSKQVIDKMIDIVSQIGFWLIFVYPFVLLPIVFIKKRYKKGRGTS